MVTAWHVLVDAGGEGVVGDRVLVDSLRAGMAGPVPADAVAVDAVHDLAVLVRHEALPDCESRLAASASQTIGDRVVITGHGLLDDPSRAPLRAVDALGIWAGSAMREDSVALARVQSSDVLRGMSGAPVIRLADGAIVGIVSARYNSTDGWFRDSVWLARVEDLGPLLDEVDGWHAPRVLDDFERPNAQIDLEFEIDAVSVRLLGDGIDVSSPHQGITFGIAQALEEVRIARARAGTHRMTLAGDPDPILLRNRSMIAVSLRRAGSLLAQSFLPSRLAQTLAAVMERAKASNIPVRIAIRATSMFTQLPWESMPDPVAHVPLALHRLVSVYRKVPAGRARPVGGPLRIVVGISAPSAGGGIMLDYERELRMIHRAVREARGRHAEVRVVPFATTSAIREALSAGDVHVLHLSGHGGPGILVLETDEGEARPVTAQQLLDEAVPAGCMPAVIALAACYTDVPAANGAASFAEALAANGAAAVIGTETSVTDRYATRLFARTYKNLARGGTADVVAAVVEARREVHQELRSSSDPRDLEIAELDEWAAVTVLTEQPATPIGDFGRTVMTDRLEIPVSLQGLLARSPGDFVGRRTEQHRIPRILFGRTDVEWFGVLLQGLGGIGKTSLAAEALRQSVDRNRDALVATIIGVTNVDQILAEIAGPARRSMVIAGQTENLPFRATRLATQSDVPWKDRWLLLRQHLLEHQALIIVLDNFDDNLSEISGDGSRSVRDNDVAELLAVILADPGQTRLLITSRYAFRLPRNFEQTLWQRRLGPLTMAETLKFVWGLPRLDTLEDAELERIWRVVGGHPRTLEYLDALIDHGRGRFPDITRRLTDQVAQILGGGAIEWLAAERDLDQALADAITMAADDVVLPELLDFVRTVTNAETTLRLLSVYRRPVRVEDFKVWVAERAGSSREFGGILEVLVSSTLLQLDDSDHTVMVHRWTASELQRIWSRDELGYEQIASAHVLAAHFWVTLVSSGRCSSEDTVESLFEARHHFLTAGRVDDAMEMSRIIAPQLDKRGAWGREAMLVDETLRDLPEDDPRRAEWLLNHGRLDHRKGNFDTAEAHCLAALRIFQELNDERGIANCYGNLALLKHARGLPLDAVELCRLALRITERLDDRLSSSNGYHLLGMLAQDRGDYDEAEDQYRRSLAIHEELGDGGSAAGSYHQLGIVAQLKGDLTEAERFFRRALEINERLGHVTRAATEYHQLGMIAHRRGNLAEAELFYRRSLEVHENTGNERDAAATYHQLGKLAHDSRDYVEARRLYTMALEMRNRYGEVGLNVDYHQLGILARDEGDSAKAEELVRKALELANVAGDVHGVAECAQELGILLQARGELVDAEALYLQALGIRTEIGDRAGIAATNSQLGLLRSAQDRFAEAISLHVSALVERATLNLPEVAIDLRALTSLSEQCGRLEVLRIVRQLGEASDAPAIDAILAVFERGGFEAQ